MGYLPYLETPEQEISHPLLASMGVQLIIKREDLNHPFVSGNKWWKLKYNIIEALQNGYKTVLTFGGAYSNHIYATAFAAREMGLNSIGIIRGEETLPLNKTLQAVTSQGMKLHYISRTDYARKTESDFIERLMRTYGKVYVIPEGGTNLNAIRGCLEFSEKLRACDHIFLAVGTGGTISGLVCGLKGRSHISGIPVLKNGEFLEQDINDQISSVTAQKFANWKLLTGYHQGGYAKTTPGLLEFMKSMKHEYDLPLDHVYTGKMLFAVFDLLRNGYFKRGETILALHTGGLQGSM